MTDKVELAKEADEMMERLDKPNEEIKRVIKIPRNLTKPDDMSQDIFELIVDTAQQIKVRKRKTGIITGPILNIQPIQVGDRNLICGYCRTVKGILNSRLIFVLYKNGVAVACVDCTTFFYLRTDTYGRKRN